MVWQMFNIKNWHQNNIIDCVMSSCKECRSGVFIDNKFQTLLLFVLLTLNKQMLTGENIYGMKV